MTYDLRGAFQVLTGHHTNLYNSTGDIFRVSTDSSVNLFISAGVPKEKIVIGSAFYSRIWRGVRNFNNGLFQMAKTPSLFGENYDLLKYYFINKNGFKRYWDDEVKAPYLFNGCNFISYDDEESLEHKCNYLRDNDLLGMMF